MQCMCIIVEFKLRKLRSSVTLSEMRKASVLVAVSLLEIAAIPSCHNPIACLKRALVFLSHKGTRVEFEYLRKPLPNASDCTANDALVILGRADCMIVLSCAAEALFLCEFVARTCKSRRKEKRWSSKWRVVSIYLQYISSKVHKHSKYSVDWCAQLIEEIHKGRCNAIELVPTFQNLERQKLHHNQYIS